MTESDRQHPSQDVNASNHIPSITNGVERKFHADGTAKPFSGNTIICHTQQEGPFRDVLVRLHDALAKASFRRKIALLPPDSYHMTVFSGADDQDRPQSNWPGGVNLDLPIAECNRILSQRVQKFRLHCDLPLRLRLMEEETLEYGPPCSLRVAGADQAAEMVLRSLRKQLAALYRISLPDPDTYGFHITIAYTLQGLSPQQTTEYRHLVTQSATKLIAAGPVLELGLPEFCTFSDMNRYDIRHYLRLGA